MKTRLMASATHLLASAVVIGLFIALVFLIWYPGPLDELHTTTDVLTILIGVDLVLGPLMTLIIFDTRKPARELFRDVSLIVLVQIIALGWGIHVTYGVRPVAVVFNRDTFYSVTLENIRSNPAADESGLPRFWQAPEFVFTPALTGKEAVEEFMKMMKEGRPHIIYQPAQYLPLADHREKLLASAMPLSYASQNDRDKQAIDDFIEHHGGGVEDYAFYPLRFGQYKTIVGLRRNDLSVAGLLVPVTIGL